MWTRKSNCYSCVCMYTRVLPSLPSGCSFFLIWGDVRFTSDKSEKQESLWDMMRFTVKVCFHLGWVCPFQLSRSDLFNRNDFLEFLAPYSCKIVFRFFQNCIMQLFPCWKIWLITQKGSLSLNLDPTPYSREFTVEKGTRAREWSFCHLSWLLNRQTHRQTWCWCLPGSDSTLADSAGWVQFRTAAASPPEARLDFLLLLWLVSSSNSELNSSFLSRSSWTQPTTPLLIPVPPQVTAFLSIPYLTHPQYISPNR